MSQWILPSDFIHSTWPGWSIVYIEWLQFILVFHSLKIAFVLANSVDPDEMSHDAAFHLGIHGLPKYALKLC